MLNFFSFVIDISLKSLYYSNIYLPRDYTPGMQNYNGGPNLRFPRAGAEKRKHILCATNTLSVQYSKFPTPDLAHGEVMI